MCLPNNMGRKYLEVYTLNVTSGVRITEIMSQVVFLFIVYVINEKYYLVNSKKNKI